MPTPADHTAHEVERGLTEQSRRLTAFTAFIFFAVGTTAAVSTQIVMGLRHQAIQIALVVATLVHFVGGIVVVWLFNESYDVPPSERAQEVATDNRHERDYFLDLLAEKLDCYDANEQRLGRVQLGTAVVAVTAALVLGFGFVAAVLG